MVICAFPLGHEHNTSDSGQKLLLLLYHTLQLPNLLWQISLYNLGLTMCELKSLKVSTRIPESISPYYLIKLVVGQSL